MSGVMIEYGVPVIAIIIAAIGAMLKIYLGRVVAKMKLSALEQSAYDLVLVGVTSAYDEIVSKAKAAASDGKLTKGERAEARIFAINKAKELAKDEIKEFLSTMAKERLNNWVELAVNKMKSKS